jgi:S-adenosylmethionine:tRNA ribosyltransferase-isomerase
LRTDDFDFDLPPGLIAQQPAEPRDSARLLVLRRDTGQISHHRFSELPDLLDAGDLLVANRTKVLPSRLEGERVGTGGRVEALLLHPKDTGAWMALVKPGRRLQPGSLVRFSKDKQTVLVEVGERTPSGARTLRPVLQDPSRLSDLLGLGNVPLPPYIKEWQGDPERYQTIYADRPGSAAAPTAGLHFTHELLERLLQKDVQTVYVTLHVGPDTFRPIRASRLAEHVMHAEWAEVTQPTLMAIDQARQKVRRVVAVGTTTVRALESAAARPVGQSEWSGWTQLFIAPGHQFRSFDALITNFHLPRSTLLVLVSALAGIEHVRAAYRVAVAEQYRFYSFGDAMLIL